MPLLKYKCVDCATVFDALVSVSRIGEVRCERCGGETERAYEGRCLFGIPGSSAGRGGSCSGNCGGCSGCGAQGHAAGCSCGHC